MHALQAEGRTALAVRVWRTLLGVALLVWTTDVATKIWAVNSLSHRGAVKIIGSFFQLNFVRNSGAAFSFAPGATLFLSIFGIVILLGIAYYAVSLIEFFVSLDYCAAMSSIGCSFRTGLFSISPILPS